MRNPARIPGIVSKLAARWLASPDLRLGQLVVNLANGWKGGGTENTTFYVEDDALEAEFDKLPLAATEVWVHADGGRYRILYEFAGFEKDADGRPWLPVARVFYEPEVVTPDMPPEKRGPFSTTRERFYRRFKIA